MATTKVTDAAGPKTRKSVELVDRIKTQLSTATLKSKVSNADLDNLAAHITKLKALLS